VYHNDSMCASEPQAQTKIASDQSHTGTATGIASSSARDRAMLQITVSYTTTVSTIGELLVSNKHLLLVIVVVAPIVWFEW
jgi:hypothetical protein